MKLHFFLLILIGSLTTSCTQQKKEGTTATKPEMQDTITKIVSEKIPVIEKKADTILRQASEFVYGIDISHHQGNEVDQLDKQKDSLGFIICKATEGVTYTDPKFSNNWKAIKEKLFIRGAYHFYRTADDPLAQAAHFLTAISDLQNTDLPPIIDFEEGGIDKTQSVQEIQAALKTFLAEIENKTKRKPIIYTDINTGDKYLDQAFFADYPLWIANYNGKQKPDLPKAWLSKGWLIWQRTASYRLDNFTDDFDVFNGSLMNLKAFIKNSN